MKYNIILSLYKGYRLSNQKTLSLWEHMLAEIMQVETMQDEPPQSGTCTGGRCFVVVNGDGVLLDDNEQYAHESGPCLQYNCSVREGREIK